MKATELRIGNWVQLNQFYDETGPLHRIFVEVKEIKKERGYTTEYVVSHVNGTTAFDDKFLAPIPLTEERLLKFGFEIHSDYSFRNFILPKNNFGVSQWMENKPVVGFEETGAFYWSYGFRKIEYVHQLQNLFHALTGEELTITEQ